MSEREVWVVEVIPGANKDEWIPEQVCFNPEVAASLCKRLNRRHLMEVYRVVRYVPEEGT